MPVAAVEIKAYERVAVRPLTGSIGAEVTDVDLRDVDEDTFAELRDAWLTYKVLVYRDQTLDQAQQVAFGRRWGDLEVHPFATNVEAFPELLILESTPERFDAAESWHSDVTFRACPSMGSILRAVVLPPVGGDTVFANMELAYEQLSDELKDQIEGRFAVHSMMKPFGRHMSPEKRAKAMEEFPDQHHPIVRTHPETGRRSLYVNRVFTTGIVDMDPAEAKPLLERLERQAHVPQFQCRVRWAPGTLTQWDNRCTQHYAVPDYAGHHRRMERVTLAGDRPF
jgi:taurine dioxygenase